MYLSYIPVPNAINFAERILHIDEKEKQIIAHALKSLLFNNGESWIKQANKLFDVTTGAYDDANSWAVLSYQIYHPNTARPTSDYTEMMA